MGVRGTSRRPPLLGAMSRSQEHLEDAAARTEGSGSPQRLGTQQPQRSTHAHNRPQQPLHQQASGHLENANNAYMSSPQQLPLSSPGSFHNGDSEGFNSFLHSPTPTTEGSEPNSGMSEGRVRFDSSDSSTEFAAEVEGEGDFTLSTPTRTPPGHLGLATATTVTSVARNALVSTATVAAATATVGNEAPTRQAESSEVSTRVTVSQADSNTAATTTGMTPTHFSLRSNPNSDSNYSYLQPQQHPQQLQQQQQQAEQRSSVQVLSLSQNSFGSPSGNVSLRRASHSSANLPPPPPCHDHITSTPTAASGSSSNRRRRDDRQEASSVSRVGVAVGEPNRMADHNAAGSNAQRGLCHARSAPSAEDNTTCLSTGGFASLCPQLTSSGGTTAYQDQQQQQEPRRKEVRYSTQRQHPPVCASSTTSSRDWVRLNVGGRVFLSTFATLCSDPNSVLAAICEPLLASRRRAEGEEEQLRSLASKGGSAAAASQEQHWRQRRRRRQRPQGEQDHGAEAISLSVEGGAAAAPFGAGRLNGSVAGGQAEDVEATTTAGEGSRDTSAKNAAAPPPSSSAPVGMPPRNSEAHNRVGDGADLLPTHHHHHHQQHACHSDPYCGNSGGTSPPRTGPPPPLSSSAPSSPDVSGPSTGAPVATDNDAGGGELPNPGSEDSLAVVPLDMDEHNAILLDLDPDYFAPILNYMRHRTVIIPPTLSARGVLAVAEYLNVQGMVRQLAPERRVRRQVLSSWGSGGSGELGTQRFLDSETPTPVQVTPFGVKVVHMALGANYSCALSDDGNIYTFGNGDWGQLGLGSPKDLDVHPTDKSAVVVVPRRIPLFERHSALHVSAGYAFAMAIIKDHHVYFWGNNNHGQSGLGPRFFDYNTRKADEPKLVDTLEGKRIVQLGCGSFFSLALSEDGVLYSWGLIECLGLGAPEEVRRRYQGTNILGESLSNEKRGVVLTPQVVSIRDNSAHRIVRIHAGQWHSGAINSAGELFTWGVGYQGRLGHGTKEPAYVPTKVRGALTGHRVVDVACGSFHTVALTDRGAVFCWGDNASSQCGTSAAHTEAVTSPYRVVGLEFIAGGVAKSISCGRQHTVVVMEGPQPGCQGPCCQLDYRGRPYHTHAQVYTFGESTRGNGGGGAVSAAAAGSGSNNGNSSSGLDGTVGSMVAGSSGHGGRSGSHTVLIGQGGRGGRGASLVDSSGGGGAGVGSRTCSQYQLVQGLERMNVIGVVSGLHHTFVRAEEIECGPQHPSSDPGGEEDAVPTGDYYYCAHPHGNRSESGTYGGGGDGFGLATGGVAAAAFPRVGSHGTGRQRPFLQEGWGGPGITAPSSFARN